MLFALSHTFAQKPRQVVVKNVKFNLNTYQRLIEINYDVESIILEDSVYIVVTNRDKQEFKSTALKGDVGKKITPGAEKKILWDFMADSLRINDDIAITVYVKLHSLAQKPEPSPVVIATTKPAKETKKVEKPEIKIPKVPKVKKFNTWAIGLLGAGLAAGGYMVYDGLAQKKVAEGYYQTYIDNSWNQKIIVSDDAWLKQYSEGSIATANAMLTRAQDKLKKANTMLYSGIGVIVADAILTIPKIRRKTGKKLSFNTNYLPSSQTFVLGANFKF
jgi:hypothetical protein